ncbi:RES family NAD+ phosphorylase [Oryzifoliimicrobium ureilyticus]|uniref:RES family NAD+ phosphorylase n=1 Tax=Oryzifoliimicrobium ureilyticus TaxID=3113724 RepID=UPI003075F352
MRYQGKLYRALNPIYAREPLSGRGAELYGGRFNSKGVPAIYTSLNIMTALKEANQVGKLQPTTLVCYDADLETVFDCRDNGALRVWGMDPGALADPSWRDQMRLSGEAKTQTFARHLAADGHCGMLVKSFAPGATDDDLNLVLWTWGNSPPGHLKLIDDEDRLSSII